MSHNGNGSGRRANATSFGGIAGNPQNRNGSPGRPSKYVRERAAWSWEQRIPQLEKFADGDDAQDAIAAMRELRAVGFADRVEHSGSVGTLTPEEREDRVAAILNGARKRIKAGNGNGHR